MPFTVRNLKQDLEVAVSFQFRRCAGPVRRTHALELEQSGLCYERIPPGSRLPYGHTHKTQEEVYVAVRGSGRMKLDDGIVELKQWHAVRVPPGTWRGLRSLPRPMIVIGAPSLGGESAR